MMYYALHICVLLSSHLIRLVNIYTQKALWFTHVSFSDKTIHVGVWTFGQRAPTRTPLPHPHPHIHLPTSRLAWLSRTMSHLEGNSRAASSSVVASSAASSMYFGCLFVSFFRRLFALFRWILRLHTIFYRS